MKKIIVTTTIHPVTEAIRKFQEKKDWELIVIGDKKTPPDYKLQRGMYVSCEDQEKYDPKLSDAIVCNCIQRRNFGLLFAWDQGADVIALVDDDNIPYDHWGQSLTLDVETEVNHFETLDEVFDPVGAVSNKKLWHRGFPLQLLSRRNYDSRSRRRITPHVQADFWNGDPDIDAICRMEHAPQCDFDITQFPLSSNKPAPFNSQNTFITREILKDYFLFPHIGRMDDIWAAFYVQSKTGASVLFQRPSVFQLRNDHDLTKDMKQEYLGYEHNLSLVRDLATDPERIRKYLPPRSLEAFEHYRRHFS